MRWSLHWSHYRSCYSSNNFSQKPSVTRLDDTAIWLRHDYYFPCTLRHINRHSLWRRACKRCVCPIHYNIFGVSLESLELNSYHKSFLCVRTMYFSSAVETNRRSKQHRFVEPDQIDYMLPSDLQDCHNTSFQSFTNPPEYLLHSSLSNQSSRCPSCFRHRTH